MSERSLFKIFSFYNAEVAAEIPDYQRQVFAKFGLSINQVYHPTMTHSEFLHQTCKQVTDTDYLIFFDIDCVPTQRMWLNKLITDLLEPRTIVGCAQSGQQGCNLYVSSFCFAISTAYLRELNYPEAGQSLTDHIRQQGGGVSFWWPTHVEDPRWQLKHPVHKSFGPGTTYDDMVYHAFEWSDGTGFINKCKEILAREEGPGND